MNEMLMLYILLGVGASFFLMSISFIFEWIERKTIARAQNRVGPLLAGPKGVFQGFADFIKLMTKQSIIPMGVDKVLLFLFPVLGVTLATFAVMFIPFITETPLLMYQADLIYVMGISAALSVFIVFTGYVNPGPYSNIGAARYAELFISYEVPFVVSLGIPAMIARSLEIDSILLFQKDGLWLLFIAPLGFVVLIVSVISKIERIPFDAAEAETEIAGGWQVELSGKYLAYFKLLTNLKMLVLVFLCVALYLGGGYLPGIDTTGVPGLYFVVFMLKAIILVILIALTEAIMARWRIDNILNYFWRVITPLVLIQILILFVLMGVGVI